MYARWRYSMLQGWATNEFLETLHWNPDARNLPRQMHSTTASLRGGSLGVGTAVIRASTCLCGAHAIVVDDFTFRNRRSEEHMGISDSAKSLSLLGMEVCLSYRCLGTLFWAPICAWLECRTKDMQRTGLVHEVVEYTWCRRVCIIGCTYTQEG